MISRTFNERLVDAVSAVAQLSDTADQYTAFLAAVVTRIFYVTLYYRITDYAFYKKQNKKKNRCKKYRRYVTK